ncbi:hypothetical protein TRIUR3_20073 [Triticum urartu]|uniref:Uncharacterized protein n=1 Tax=Triticum urartu TaxID=4572 RepID=M7YKS4_TRIUA|nr:hypothetical protein TRIUR3_20073 [Triticum urartu]
MGGAVRDYRYFLRGARGRGFRTAMSVPVSGKRSGHRERQGQQEKTGGVGEEERQGGPGLMIAGLLLALGVSGAPPRAGMLGKKREAALRAGWLGRETRRRLVATDLEAMGLDQGQSGGGRR